MARIVIERLTKVFEAPGSQDLRAVNGASLTVNDKELMVVVGPSGCGKTTLLRLIAGLEEPTEGTISMDDRRMNEIAPKERDVTMVFQNCALYPHMPAFENMAFGLKLRKYSKTEIAKRVAEAAELLKIGDCLGRYPRELSGGQRQRIALGRAIVREPKLLLFDEPLSNLDVHTRAELRTELLKLHRRFGWTMIYVTHDQTEAMTMGDRVVVMKSGVIQQISAPLHLYRRPENVFVANFMGAPAMNFFRGVVEEREGQLYFSEKNGVAPRPGENLAVRLDSEAAGMNGYLGKKVIFGIRPENISGESLKDAPGTARVEAMVEVAEPLGTETHLHLISGANPFVARVPGIASVTIGQRVPVIFDMRHAHFFDPETEKRIV